MENWSKTKLELVEICRVIYEAGDNAARVASETKWSEFCRQPEFLQLAANLIESGDSVYTQLVTVTTLTRMVANVNCTIPLDDRLRYRSLVLEILSGARILPKFLLQAYIQLYANLTKYGWLDTRRGVEDPFVFRTVISDVTPFLQTTREKALIGLQLLHQLIVLINYPDGARTITRHRKTAVSFRDGYLFDIFQTATQHLSEVNEQTAMYDVLHDETAFAYVQLNLQLFQACLGFDFLGMMSDESSDDITLVQVPMAWRTYFIDASCLTLFFGLFVSLPAPSLASRCLAALTQLVSVRRSLFSTTERAHYLQRIAMGLQSLLTHPAHLVDPECYHEFCRLLAHLKSNYQLSELVKCLNYEELIKLIGEFSIQSLHAFSFSANSAHYLLSFWQRLVASIPYMKASDAHYLDKYAPEVTQAFLLSRVNSTDDMSSSREDPLEDFGQVEVQLEQLATIARCEYTKNASMVYNLMLQQLEHLQGFMNQPEQEQVVIAKLTWLVYIVGAFLSGRMPFTSDDSEDQWDGELTCKVIQLAKVMNNRLEQGQTNERFELSLLYFYEHFRRIYIADQVQRSSKLYTQLARQLDLDEDVKLLRLLIEKVVTNLKYGANSERIIQESLALLDELSIGYTAAKKLIKIEGVSFLLFNHTEEHFTFLSAERTPEQMKCRRKFYEGLGRLAAFEIFEEEDTFHRFMGPVTARLVEIKSAMSRLAELKSPVDVSPFTRRVIGLSRDLTGIAAVFTNKMCYTALCEWLHEDCLDILKQAIRTWYMDPAVSTPILQLIEELAHNRSQRCMFENSSPQGYILFKEISAFIVEFGTAIMAPAISIPTNQLWEVKLKPMVHCFCALKNALNGGYVNFGVFQLYGDSCLDSSLQVVLQFIKTTSQDDLLNYPKLSLAYYNLMESLASAHMEWLSSCDSQIVSYIMETLAHGVSMQDTTISSLCCSILDNILTFVFKSCFKPPPNKQANMNTLCQVLQDNEQYLCMPMASILNTVMFEECRNLWSMSRPLLPLVLMADAFFTQLSKEIISCQPEAKKGTVAECFKTLREDIEPTLSMKNRDKFTQNLNIFRRELNESLRITIDEHDMIRQTLANGRSTLPEETMC